MVGWGEDRLTRGVLVMVMALLPTLIGSWPEPRSLRTSWPEGGEGVTAGGLSRRLALSEMPAVG